MTPIGYTNRPMDGRHALCDIGQRGLDCRDDLWHTASHCWESAVLASEEQGAHGRARPPQYPSESFARRSARRRLHASQIPAGTDTDGAGSGPLRTRRAVADGWQPQLAHCAVDLQLDRSRQRVAAVGDDLQAHPVASVASDETSYPAFSFQYGDYEGVAVAGGVAHPIWTDSRRNQDTTTGCSRGLMEEVFTTSVK